MILVIASIGMERITPGIPHIQNQKTSEMMTRTGVEGEPPGQKHRRYSLALNQMKPKIKCRRKQRLPERIMGQHTSEKKDRHAQGSSEDRHIVQQKGHGTPEDRITHPREPHRQCSGDTYSCIHDRDCDKIRRDVTFYFLRDFHDLALTPKARKYLDEAVQEDIARHKKEKDCIA